MRQVRQGRGGGGVSTYLKNGIGIVSSKGFTNGWMEVLAVQTNETLYINIYKSPGIDTEKLKGHAKGDRDDMPSYLMIFIINKIRKTPWS